MAFGTHSMSYIEQRKTKPYDDIIPQPIAKLRDTDYLKHLQCII